MVRTYKEVPKRAKNSINAHLKNLIKKYGEREVRLVATKHFEKSSKQRKLEKEIEQREAELQRMKRQIK